MKSGRIIKAHIVLILVLKSLLLAQNLSDLSLIAHYPLSSSADDTTGQNDPMTLINIAFQDGGIYCNGNAAGSDANWCMAETPEISGLDFSSFAISAEFKIIDPVDTRRPILVGGKSYRWSSLILNPDSAVCLGHRMFFGVPSSLTKIKINTWQQISYTYEGSSGKGILYLDGAAADSSTQPVNFADDKKITITHEGAGVAYMGLLKNLKIYSKDKPVNSNPDSLALVALYNSTDGPNWTKRDNWLNGPIATWHGISVSENRVTRIDLNNNLLQGILPPEIGNLTELSFLNLYGNQLSDAIPAHLGNLKKLVHINLGKNRFLGSIPAQMRELLKLEILIVSYNRLSGQIPSVLGDLKELILLNLSNNELTGSIPATLGSLAKLTQLYLSQNNLTGTVPASLSKLSNLQYLYIDHNSLSVLPDLSSLANLAYLSINANAFTFEDIEPHIGIAHYSYNPQDSIGVAQDTTLSEGQPLELSTNVGGTANQYQWYHGINKINSADRKTLSIPSLAFADSGVYTCTITNTIATGLTLYSKAIKVHIMPRTEVASAAAGSPYAYTFSHNYPNPFNPSTTLSFTVPSAQDVSIKIYDIRGVEVETILMKKVAAGAHTLKWMPANQPSGLYFIQLRAKDFVETQKAILQK